MFLNLIWNNKHVRIEAKLRIYKATETVLIPSASETRSSALKVQRQLHTAGMTMARKLNGITLSIA